MNDLFCRKASKEDLPAVLRLYAQPEMDDGDVLPLPDAQSLYDKFSRYPDYHLYVAVLDSQVIGSFELLIMDNLGHLGTPSAVIEDVVVDPEFQGQGVGKKMMKRALQICKHKGCYKVVISSNLRRERAHAFYRSLGFEQHGYSFRINGQEEHPG